MLYTVLKKNSYQDSINLMLLTKQLSAMDGVAQVSIMMGTPANLDIMKASGMYTDDLSEATPSDICIVVDSKDASIVDKVLEGVEHFLKNQAVASKSDQTPVARSWDSAMRKLPDANWALISVAGTYAAKEADKALDRGLHVMIFSDNISVSDELALKEKARDKGLLVMGPDCGTAVISGVPLAFANALEKGNIGIVGASGTGIQEVSTLISRLGGGCSQVIGLGGRDLTSDIGGIMAFSAIDLLAEDDETDLIVFISKPPAPEVRKKVVSKLSALDKPVVAIFLGEKLESEGNIHYAWTLDQAAELAVSLSHQSIKLPENELSLIRANKNQRGIQGLYSGGTLASEAGMLLAHHLGTELDKKHPDGLMFRQGQHRIIDLGDDAYTQGRPHPMIDPSLRLDMVKEQAMDDSTAIILLDFVIGYGGHDNIASEFAPVIKRLHQELSEKNRSIIFIGSVTGTQNDPINYEEQRRELEEAGVYILDSNAKAVSFALSILSRIESPAAEKSASAPSDFWDAPRVINMGIKHFVPPIQENGGQAVQFQWNPVAGGNEELAELLEKLYAI